MSRVAPRPPARRSSSARIGSRGAIVRAAAGLALTLACAGGDALPEPGTDAYRRAVTTFHVGLAAAQVGLDERAEERWLETVEIAPGEPAAWADLGMLAVRRNEPEVARERMERAVSLAPDHAAIRYAAGVAAVATGDWAVAEEHLRAAVDAEPGHLRALHALADLASRTGGPDADAEARGWLERALEVEPDNLAARVELARVAAKQGDRAALEDALARFRARSGDWPAAAVERLEAVDPGAEPARAAADLAMLANVLQRSPRYRESLRALRPEGGVRAVLVDRFVRLPAPPASPSPPDTALAFDAEPLVFDAAGGIEAPDAALVRAISIDGESPPAPVVATATEVRLGEARAPFPGGGVPPGLHGLLAADLDNDYRAEIVLAGEGGLRILAVDETGAVVDRTAERGVPAAIAGGRWAGAWAVDLDLEGDLDLVLGAVEGPAVVLVNGTDGSLTPAEPAFGAADLRDLAWADLDGDGDADLALLGADGRVRAWANRGAGLYDPMGDSPTRTAFAAIEVAEIDGDGALDLIGLDAAGAIRRIAIGEDDGAPALVPDAAAVASGERPLLAAADLDNNGCVDLLVATAAGSRAWLCGADRVPGARRVEIPGQATGLGDLDGDGLVDLVGTADGRPAAFAARGGAGYGWLRLKPRAAERAGDQRVNAYGLAGEVEVRSGLLYQKLPVDGPVVHVGLGDRAQADLARVVWPHGLVQVEFDLDSTATVAIRQRLMGSCPWLFVWDGSTMRFVTDVVWPSPMGARLAPTETAPLTVTEDRTLLPGALLVPRDGAYDVRITTELWETFFIDDVSLLAVDHPEGTIVRVDERFAFRPLELSARAFEPARPIARASDGAGADVTALVRERDLETLRPAPGPLQGLAAGEHAVAIELGNDAAGRPGLALLATGWVVPMESAGRIAAAQGAGIAPRGLALDVPDGSGGWSEAATGLGMPAGKDKTIVIDLDGLLPPDGPARIRLRTNLEIAWDAFAWTVARPDAPVETREIPLGSAALSYRGFSAVRDDAPSEVPIYDRVVATRPRWRDLEGYYTRHGDVGELLQGVDDRYVIVNAGDEIRLTFPALDPPRPGWIRDFVLVTDGWGRNGDYGTEFSDTVLPLPSHEKTRWPVRADRLEDDPVYRRFPDDWRTYHTRYVTPGPFRRALVGE